MGFNPFVSAQPPKVEFVDWCKEVAPDIGQSTSFSRLRTNLGDGANQRATFENISHSALPEFISFDQKITEDGCVLDGKKHGEIKKISVQCASNFTIQNLKIYDLSIGPGDLILINCKIKRLTLDNNAKVRLIDSHVGCLNVLKRGCSEFKAVRGGILNIDCSPPKSNNPFTGSVVFINTFFPKNTNDYLLKNAQPYRNMRHHLMSLENEVMASKFHSLELVIERETDPFPDNLLSYMYAAFSSYGGSIIKPFIWFTLLLLISWLAIGSINGADIAMNEEAYHGWQKALCEEDAAYSRAAVLVGQYVFNPFGVLGTKALVVAKSNGVLFWMMVQSFLSATLITLLILAIRRRFKLK